MLQFLDHFLTVFHSAFVLFVMFGWAHKRTRSAHIAALTLTALAWGVLGLKYGLGYCPLTDWHWDIKRELGETPLPNSFTKYIIDKITGLNTPPKLIDAATLGGLLFGVAMATTVYLRSRKQRK